MLVTIRAAVGCCKAVNGNLLYYRGLAIQPVPGTSSRGIMLIYSTRYLYSSTCTFPRVFVFPMGACTRLVLVLVQVVRVLAELTFTTILGTSLLYKYKYLYQHPCLFFIYFFWCSHHVWINFTHYYWLL